MVSVLNVPLDPDVPRNFGTLDDISDGEGECPLPAAGRGRAPHRGTRPAQRRAGIDAELTWGAGPPGRRDRRDGRGAGTRRRHRRRRAPPRVPRTVLSAQTWALTSSARQAATSSSPELRAAARSPRTSPALARSFVPVSRRPKVDVTSAGALNRSSNCAATASERNLQVDLEEPLEAPRLEVAGARQDCFTVLDERLGVQHLRVGDDSEHRRRAACRDATAGRQRAPSYWRRPVRTAGQRDTTREAAAAMRRIIPRPVGDIPVGDVERGLPTRHRSYDPIAAADRTELARARCGARQPAPGRGPDSSAPGRASSNAEHGKS